MQQDMDAGQSTLEEICMNYPAVDSHCHNIVDVTATLPYLVMFTEGSGDAISDAATAINAKRGLRELAALLDVPSPDPAALVQTRAALGLEGLMRRCLASCRLQTLLMDDGLVLGDMRELEWHAQFVDTRRVLRIETVAQRILEKGPEGGSPWTLDALEQAFLSAADTQLPANVVAFKSVVCYRSGLDIDPGVSRAEAQAGLDVTVGSQSNCRIEDKRLVDWLFTRALEVATARGLPMQVHTGMGDLDQDLRQSNPAHLRRVLADPRFASARVVLLHGSWPYAREASFMASVYPQVFVDTPVVRFYSRAGGRAVLQELLEAAPLSKVMFSSDAAAFPEAYYLSVKWGREILAEVLGGFVEDGDLTSEDSKEVAKDILARNAARLYKL